MERKKVNSAGLEWTVLSANERCTSTLDGRTGKTRYFFAVRCNTSQPFSLHEHSGDMLKGEGWPLHVFFGGYGTLQLGVAVREICGQLPIVAICDQCHNVEAIVDQAMSTTCSCCNATITPHPSLPWDQYRGRRKALAEARQ